VKEIQIVWILYSLPVLATPGDSTSIEGASSTEASSSETRTGGSLQSEKDSDVSTKKRWNYIVCISYC